MNFNVQEVWESIRTHRVQVVQELRVDRTILYDHLRSKQIFDLADCELVNAEKTNESKASKLLDILQSKAPESLFYFVDVLQSLNPGVYEKLTGQRAAARENPIINEVSDHSFTDLDPQRDLDILISHRKRAATDRQDMALRYDQLLKENQRLKKSLSEVTLDRDLNFKCWQTAEDQVLRADERAKEAWKNAGKIQEAANFQKKEYEKAIRDKTVCFLAVMSSEKETRQLRKQVEEGRRRNEELMCRLQELSQNINFERSRSLKLSEKIARQRNSIKTTESLENQYREIQFILQKEKMEKDQAISELNELKNWAEALKTCYDFVEKNKQQCQQSYDNAVVKCSQFKKEKQELKFHLSVFQQQDSNVKAQNDELTRLVKKYQEQRDFYGEERIKAINERDEARKERDEMYQQFSDMQKEKDEALQRLFLNTREFERRQETDADEKRALRERLLETEMKLKSLKMEWELSLDIRQSTMTRNNATVKSLRTGNDDDGNADGDDDGDKNVFDNGIEAVQCRNPRNLTKLVNSIKRRFYNSSSGVSPLENPGTDEEVFYSVAISSALRRLVSLSGENSSVANAFNFEFLPSANSPTVDDFSDAEMLQEQTVNAFCTDKWEDEMVSILPDPRPRVYALDRWRTPKAFHLYTAL